MTNRVAQFNEIYDEINKLRSVIFDLTSVTRTMLDSIERHEEMIARYIPTHCGDCGTVHWKKGKYLK